MGAVDKTIRIIIALVIGYLYYANIVAGTLGIALLVVAIIFMFTSLVGFYPLYTIVGTSTCPKKK